MFKKVGTVMTVTAVFALLALSGCTAGLDNMASDASGSGSGGGGSAAAPTAVEIEAQSGGVTIIWEHADSPTEYNVYGGTTSPVTKDDTKYSVTNGTKELEINELINGTLYYFAVTAVISGIESELSEQVFALPMFSSTKLHAMSAGDSAAADAFYGSALDFYGDYMIVGSQKDSTYAHYAGMAYVYRNVEVVADISAEIDPSLTKATDLTTSLLAKLDSDDNQENDYYGWAVSLTKDTDGVYHAGVTSPYKNNMDGNGAVYFYDSSDGDTWTHVKTFASPDYQDNGRFGISIDMDGKLAIVGAIKEKHGGQPNAGAAYIFRYGADGWAYEEQLLASDPIENAYFGRSVKIFESDIDGADYAFVGAYRDDCAVQYVGAAYVFKYSGGNWSQVAKISSENGGECDEFGSSIAKEKDGETLVIGAPGKDDGKGAAYFYKKDSGADTWTGKGKCLEGNGASTTVGGGTDAVGTSVSIKGNLAAIGAPGYVNSRGVVFVCREQDDGSWSYTAQLEQDSAAANDQAGKQVQFKDDKICYGAEGVNNSTGAAYCAF